jgi:hypothetical protein
MKGQILNVIGHSLEVWYVPRAAHMPCMHRSHNIVLGIKVFVACFFKTSL